MQLMSNNWKKTAPGASVYWSSRETSIIMAILISERHRLYWRYNSIPLHPKILS